MGKIVLLVLSDKCFMSFSCPNQKLLISDERTGESFLPFVQFSLQGKQHASDLKDLQVKSSQMFTIGRVD